MKQQISWLSVLLLIVLVSDGGGSGRGGSGGGGGVLGVSADCVGDDCLELVPLPAGLRNQDGHTYLKQSTVVNHFGAPCAFKTSCQAVSNPKVKALLKTVQVHDNFKAYGLGPAVERLRAALDAFKADHPRMYPRLGFSGMLCCRAVRGSSTSYSNHAFGMAVDFNIDGQLDPRADGKTQRGLQLLYPFMHEQGFFWAAGYSPAYEDAMHFEISQQTFTAWLADGTLGGASEGDPPETVEECAWPLYSLARDRNDPPAANIYALQRLLAYRGYAASSVDGRLGPSTDGQIRAFQSSRGLKADGIVGRLTWTALFGANSVLRSSGSSADGRVMAVQELLMRTYGANLGSAGVDGFFGARSKQALQDFQQRYHFARDGEADLVVLKGLLTRCTGPLTPSRKQSFLQEPERAEDNAGGSTANADGDSDDDDGPNDGLILAILLPTVTLVTLLVGVAAWALIRYRHNRSVVPDFLARRLSERSAGDSLRSPLNEDHAGEYALMEEEVADPESV